MGLTFGKKYSEAPAATSSSGKWIKSLKEGDTKIRFLQEVRDWHVYYEHYNPAGSPFPCTGDKNTCPGCTSNNERMKQASRKNAVAAVVQGYVDIYKLPVKLTNRLVAKSERNGGTITDRDYLLTRIGKDTNTEYEIESMTPRPLDGGPYEIPDVEEMLMESFKENWPDFDVDDPQPQPEKVAPKAYEDKPFIDAAQEEKPPFEQATSTQDSGEVEVTEAELRSMSLHSILDLCQSEKIELPTEVAQSADVNSIVDYLLENA